MRAIVNVATGPYVRGAARFQRLAPGEKYISWRDQMPPGSPAHAAKPYAFKAYALAAAAQKGYATLLWADASIVPHQPLAGLWERIERDGYWISRNGWTNFEWTCKEAYPDLFPHCYDEDAGGNRWFEMERAEEENRDIPHVVATAFGVCLGHQKGQRIFEEYLRLAQTRAFIGPWRGGVGVQHRHDQTALSVIAHREGCVLTDPPAWFSYRGGETAETVLIADGAY